jgi:hypothetical protein
MIVGSRRVDCSAGNDHSHSTEQRPKAFHRFVSSQCPVSLTD